MRQEILAENEVLGKEFWRLHNEWALRTEDIQLAPTTPSKMSPMRRWLGDRPFPMILRLRKADAARAVELFPEAHIMFYTGAFSPRVEAAMNRVLEAMEKAGVRRQQ
jgi:hypothetical protein